jgi:hypothetical protein
MEARNRRAQKKPSEEANQVLQVIFSLNRINPFLVLKTEIIVASKKDGKKENGLTPIRKPAVRSR